MVTAPAQEGLQALAQHQVGWDGDKFDAGFSTTLGAARVSPSKVAHSTASDSGSFDVTFNASVDLDGLEADALRPEPAAGHHRDGAPGRPERPVHGQRQEARSRSPTPRGCTSTTSLDQDVDLYVVYDANHDGQFTPDEIVAASATGTRRRARGPHPPGGRQLPDLAARLRDHRHPGAGLTINAIQGNDLTVTGMPSGAVPAGTPVTLHVTYNKAMTAGQGYLGELLLGPPAAPTAMTVPVQISRTP